MGYSTNEAFESLKVFMVENYGAKLASGGKEITKRCHICGDSRDRTSRHMYIGLNKQGVLVYNCFKCGASGLVDGAFFRSLGCYNVDMIQICNQNNVKSASYKEMTNKAKFVKSMNPVLSYRDSLETKKKMEYLKKRMGHDFTMYELAQFKIVLNLYDYINANTIGTLTRNKSVCDQLDQFFIGFLSLDNSYINMRRLVPEGKLLSYIDSRYVNYNIYGLQDNSHRYYVIPSKIDTLRKIKIYIAEGSFDVLGVYLNTETDKNNAIYASIGGKSYVSIVKFLIMKYGIINFELHVYVDNDVDNFEIYKLSNLVKPLGVDVFMHRNQYPGEKDYGVSKDKIVDSIIKL